MVGLINWTLEFGCYIARFEVTGTRCVYNESGLGMCQIYIFAIICLVINTIGRASAIAQRERQFFTLLIQFGPSLH